MPVTEDTKPNDNLGGFTSYKQKYSSMKSKLKAILYENELFQDELRKLQRELLDIYRDKETLLERVIQYEDIGSSSSDSESQTSDKECEIKSIKHEPKAIPTSNSNNIIINNTTTTTITPNNNTNTNNIISKPKPATSSKRRNTNPSTNVTAAKRNNNGTISNNTGPKSITNGNSGGLTLITSNNISINDNDKSVTGVVIKTDSQPSNGGAVNVTAKNSATASATMTSKATPAKPKAPCRNRSKAATNSNKNGTKSTPNGSKVSSAKTQKQNVNNNKQQQTKSVNNNGRVQLKATPTTTPTTNQINLISQVPTLEPTINNNNLVTSIQTISCPPNHNLNEHFQQQQSMTVISGHAPITTSHQINLVPQVTTIEPTIGNNLVPSIQTLARQANHAIGDQQYQHQPMTVISNRVPIVTNQINMVSQATTMGPTLGNNLIPSIQTLAGQSNHSLSDHFQQQQHQMIQQHQLHHQQQHHIPDPQTTIALGVDNSQQQHQQPIMTTQSNQAVWWWQQQQHQQTAPTHQIVTSNGQLMRHQTQPTDDGVTVVGGVDQIEHDINQGCSTPQDVLDSYNSPGQQQQQQLHQHQQQHESQQSHQHHLQQSQQQQQQHHHQHNTTDDPQQSSSSSSNHLSEQSKQDLNNQQQNSAYSTQHLTTEQLSAEELEQHLESRRMEQAALLLPDWETSVPSEIFSTDSAIKFMAED